MCCVARMHTHAHAYTHTHTPRPTLEHCSKVKQKDTTWTGSEIRGCAKLWDEQRATLAETLKIKEVLGMQTVYSSLQFVQVVTEAHLELLEVMPVWKTLAITTPQVACRLDLFYIRDGSRLKSYAGNLWLFHINEHHIIFTVSVNQLTYNSINALV